MTVKFVLIYAILSLGSCKVINNELEERLSAIEKVIKEKDEIIENMERSIKSITNPPFGVFCAKSWEGGRDGDTSIITYDEMSHVSTNLDGPGLDLDTGVFTAGHNGTWSVSFHFRSTTSEHLDGNSIHLAKNGKNIWVFAGIRHVADIDYLELDIGRTTYTHLDKGDALYLSQSPHEVSHITDVTVCYELVTKY